MRMYGIFLIGFVVLISGTAVAADKYVDPYAYGANDGTSWADAWTSITKAMSDAEADDTINITNGNYVAPSGGWVPSVNNLTMVAKNIDIFNRHDTVILSGDTNGDDPNDYDLIADPCALKAAYDSGTLSDNTCIFNLADKTMTFTGLTFKGGVNSSDGGAVTISGASTTTFNDCVFTYCYSDGGGGCIKTTSTGPTTLNNCKMIRNSSWGRGSMIYASSSGSLVANNCLFKTSVAIDYGGGINIRRYPENCVFTNCIFDHCQICPNVGGSAGIMTDYRTSTTLTVSNCVFKECMTYHHGAGVYVMTNETATDVTANITNCLITGSTNIQMTGNCVALFGEVREMDSEVVMNITNCTIAGNHTNGEGHIGGWCQYNVETCKVDINLKNSIVWGNTGENGNAQLYIDTTSYGNPGWPRVSINADYCCLDNSDPNDWARCQSIGTGNLLKTADASLNPDFEVGPMGEYAISSSSPCIDTGDPTDSAGYEPKCNGGRINIGWLGGTIHATPTASSSKLADLDCDNDVDLGDFSILSGQWLQ